MDGDAAPQPAEAESAARDRESDEDESPAWTGRARRREADAVPAVAEAVDEEDLEAALEAEVEAIPDLVEEPEPDYEDDEESDEAETEEGALRAEREARRQARLAKAAPEPQAAPPRPAPRRRAAIVVHADRDSLAAGVLLARDLRLLEGIWVYPQSELMTFFRSVATDLREDTPIYLVGFTASPARETLQAAALYRERLTWFDHHVWPPEDLEGLRQAIGAENVRVTPGSGSSLPVVLASCSRRSRFTDKLLDVLTGRFSRHDYERWGGLWWWRLGEIAQASGERRAELAGLLAGRPSDLAREAAQAPPPPPPPELDFVAQRDFRLVHFGGYALVLVPVPPGLDVNLTARIARERYRARLAVGWQEGEERLVLAADDLPAGRTVDLAALVAHLAAKFEWVEGLPDDDRVARLRVQGLAAQPERLDELVSEIVMGRSILEG